MKITKYKNDFIIVEDFLSEHECDSIRSYLDMVVDKGWLKWNEISFYGSLAMGYWPYDDNLTVYGLPKDYFEQLKNRTMLQCQESLGINLTEVSWHAQKWVTGAFADYHSDNSDENGNPTAFERSKYAAFIYINDDFEGGNLKFKNHDIDISPKKGMLAVFAGGHGNEHMVTTVKSGERYTVGSFWDDASSVYSQEKKDAWAAELAEVRSQQEIMYEKWREDAKNGIVQKSQYER